MYHYVRNSNKQFSFFHFVSRKKFISQILKYKKKIIKNEDEINETSKKILLTFDDGFKDHFFVAKELKKKNLIGLFFIPSLPYINKKILNVHLVHLIIGKMGGKIAYDELIKFLKIHKLKNFIRLEDEKKFNSRYKNQIDNDYSKKFKKMINYQSNEVHIKKVLKFLLKKFKIKHKFSDIYLTINQVKQMRKMGMIIGSHSNSHRVLSRLNYKDQLSEIQESKKFIEKIIKEKCNHFCFPYGRKNSYNKYTLNILKKLKFKYAYSVESRNASKIDFSKKNFELPRFDCNEFI